MLVSCHSFQLPATPKTPTDHSSTGKTTTHLIAQVFLLFIVYFFNCSDLVDCACNYM